MRAIILVFILISTSVTGQNLTRRASWEASIKYPQQRPGAIVTKVNPGSPLDKAGIQQGDLILKVNDQMADSNESWTSITYALRKNQENELLIRRGNNVFVKKVTLNGLEKEVHENIDTYYESITSDYGITQRVIITKPKNKKEKQPAIILIQGLSCSTIEKYSGRSNNWVNMINSLVENSGFVVMRVDKPGVGDSNGDCAQTDFITELEGYRTAIRSFKEKEYIDTTKIVIYGASMGSALAPLLANEFGLSGIISDGTFFKTWFEHMLEIERRIRQMSGDNESTITKKMNEVFIPLYYGMLIQKKTYGEILEMYPAIAEYNYHPPEHMYGRPVKYYQQLQNTNLAAEWEKVKVPVRILRGTNDWIMSDEDNDMIISVLDKANHEDHELYRYPGLDHWNTIHDNPVDSFTGKPGKWDPKQPELVIGWAKEMVGMK